MRIGVRKLGGCNINKEKDLKIDCNKEQGGLAHFIKFCLQIVVMLNK